MTQETDLSNVSDGARLAGVLPYVEAEVTRMDKALDNRILGLLDKGELTPQDALNAWIEKRSYRRLGSHFDQRVRMGVSAGSRVRKDLEI